MSEETGEKPAKKGKGMLFGLIGAVVLGLGGAYATYSDMISLPFMKNEASAQKGETGGPMASAGPNVAYVVLDPITIEIGRGGRSGRLRVGLSIETDYAHKGAVEERKYRIIDTLNSFLRAVDAKDLREASKLERIRAQILRRVLIETPQGAVSDVLISEFVIL